jgi:hypothetical protein
MLVMMTTDWHGGILTDKLVFITALAFLKMVFSSENLPMLHLPKRKDAGPLAERACVVERRKDSGT